MAVRTDAGQNTADHSALIEYKHVDTFKWGEKEDELDRSSLGRFGGGIDPTRLLVGERPVILVVQDETVVRQYDCHKTYWGTEDMRILVKKTDGRGLMFSGFLTEEVGVPIPSIDQLEAINAKRIASGKSKIDRHVCLKQVDYSTEGWWNSEKMLEQTEEVMDVIEHMCCTL